MSFQSFSSGDRVVVDGKQPGTITDIFPDGIHMVRLDQNGRMIAAMAFQLRKIDKATNARSHKSTSETQRTQRGST